MADKPPVLLQADVRGATLVDLFQALAKWTPHVDEFGGKAPADGAAFFDACHALAAPVNYVRYLETLDGGRLCQRFTIRLLEQK